MPTMWLTDTQSEFLLYEYGIDMKLLTFLLSRGWGGVLFWW